mgnify:CR=1 FL=1
MLARLGSFELLSRLVNEKYEHILCVILIGIGFGHLKGEAWEERRRLMTVLLNLCWKADSKYSVLLGI